MKLTIAAILFFTAPCIGQKINIPEKDGVPFYEQIVQLDSSLSKDDMFVSAKIFLIRSFKSPKNVIELEDRILGRIIANGNFWVNYGHAFGVGRQQEMIGFIVDITLKENGKYRIQIYNFRNIDDRANQVDIKEKFAYFGEGLIGKYASYSKVKDKAKSGKKWAIEALNDFNNTILRLIEEAKTTIGKSKPIDF